MERKNRERLRRSFQQSLLHRPVPKLAYNKKSKVIKALPPPLIPTKYVAPKPKPKPRKEQPVAIPRCIPKVISEKVKKVIVEITPYFRPEAISKFAKELSDKNFFRVVVTEKDRALKDYAISFEVPIVSKEDVDLQLFKTRSDVFRLLESGLSIDRGIKVEVTLRVLMKKRNVNDDIFEQPYFNCRIFTINNKYEIQIALDEADEEIKTRVAKWLTKGSGWIVEEVQHHYINIVKYVPLRWIFISTPSRRITPS